MRGTIAIDVAGDFVRHERPALLANSILTRQAGMTSEQEIATVPAKSTTVIGAVPRSGGVYLAPLSP